VLLPLVGPEGLEPSPGRVRTGSAGANTLIPSVVFRFAARHVGAEGVEPSSCPYKRPALTVELRAAVSGAGGTRTPTCRIKSPERCRYTTTPELLDRAYRFGSLDASHRRSHVEFSLLGREIVRAGIEPAPATYQVTMLPLQHRTVGKDGVEPAVSWSQATRGTVPLHPGLSFHSAVARRGLEPLSPA
jgi:hypothetical protein